MRQHNPSARLSPVDVSMPTRRYHAPYNRSELFGQGQFSEDCIINILGSNFRQGQPEQLEPKRQSLTPAAEACGSLTEAPFSVSKVDVIS